MLGLRYITPFLFLVLQLNSVYRGDLPRLQGNVLATGPARVYPQVERIQCEEGNRIYADFTRRKSLTPTEALSEKTFRKYPFYCEGQSGILINGGIGRFSFAKVEYRDQIGYALILDRGHPSSVGENAFWLPQGKTIDIPKTPNAAQPKYVFTPGFSGCSWTVTPMNNGMLRLRHVTGDKEAIEFNNLSEAQKGGPITYAMQFKDYGYTPKNGKYIWHNTANAYMHFTGGRWTLHVQHQTCAPHPGNYIYEDGQFKTLKMFFFNQSSYSPVTATEFWRIP